MISAVNVADTDDSAGEKIEKSGVSDYFLILPLKNKTPRLSF